MMDAMKAENEKLAAAGGGGEGDSKLQDMLAAKQAELMVSCGLRPYPVLCGPPFALVLFVILTAAAFVVLRVVVDILVGNLDVVSKLALSPFPPLYDRLLCAHT